MLKKKTSNKGSKVHQKIDFFFQKGKSDGKIKKFKINNK